MIAEHDGRALVGRGPQWPPGRYSALAGFMEPGESIEEAVAREIFEEAGVRVNNVRYVASQPWPFPSQLMMACVAQAEDDVITIDPKELQDAIWISRADVKRALAGDPDAPMIAPAALRDRAYPADALGGGSLTLTRRHLHRIADAVDHRLDLRRVLALGHHADHRLGARRADHEAALALQFALGIGDHRLDRRHRRAACRP